MGETAGGDLADDVASMAESGDTSPLASGFVIFNGPRDRSAMTDFRVGTGCLTYDQLAPCQMTSSAGTESVHGSSAEPRRLRGPLPSPGHYFSPTVGLDAWAFKRVTRDQRETWCFGCVFGGAAGLLER